MNDLEFEQYEKAGYLKESFRVFYIKDYPKGEFAVHYHDFYKIIFFVDGDVEYMIEGKTYNLRPHDFVLVGPNVIHRPAVLGTKQYERYVIYISEDFFNSKNDELKKCFSIAQEENNRVVHFSPESYEDVLKSLMKLEKIGRETEDFLHDALKEAAFLEFMVQFNRCVIKQPKAFITTAVYQEKVVDVIAYIQEHLNEEISIDDLAEQFYISKYYLMRQFKLATGYSIHRYINEKRILTAKSMIMAGMPASKACFECGFSEYSTFARRFKEIVGTSPSKLMF